MALTWENDEQGEGGMTTANPVSDALAWILERFRAILRSVTEAITIWFRE